jgi:hypothetical protein
MMNNDQDAVVPLGQGIEFFAALRHLHKKVWMLEYDNEYHSLSKYKNIVDYTLRMTEFFDYYLKGMPAPRWMTTGVPAYLKNIENGLEPDSGNSEP